jgi:hypothetical protein
MSNKRQATAAVIGLAGLGIYSWIMIGSSGTAASWAWLILVASLVALASAGWAVAGARSSEERDG